MPLREALCGTCLYYNTTPCTETQSLKMRADTEHQRIQGAVGRLVYNNANPLNCLSVPHLCISLYPLPSGTQLRSAGKPLVECVSADMHTL